MGYDSTYEGTAGVEYEYNSDLEVHQEPAQNLSQELGLDPKPTKTDNVTLTIVPKLQEAAQAALSHIAGVNQRRGHRGYYSANGGHRGGLLDAQL